MIDRIDIKIGPLEPSDLPLIEAGLPRPPGMPRKHTRRLELQNDGKATYLFAWLENTPVGHLLLTWTGPEYEPMKSTIPGCPEIGDLLVREGLRSNGIGGYLLQEAERHVRSRGLQQAGLAVGIDNKRAQKLYERHRYIDAGFPRITVSWTYLDRDGKEQTEGEECTYLTKQLIP